MTALFLMAWTIHAAGWQLPWNRLLTALLADGNYWPRFATYFLCGSVFWHWRQRIPRSAGLAGAAVAAILLALSLPSLLPVVLPPAWCYLLMWLAYCPGNPVQRFCDGTDASYGTYLYAFPIQQLVMLGFRGASPWMVFLVSLPLSLLAGFGSWHLVEKRWLQKLRPNNSGNPAGAPIPSNTGV